MIVCVDHSHIELSISTGQKSLKIHPNYDALFTVIFSILALAMSIYYVFLILSDLGIDFLAYIVCILFGISWNLIRIYFNRMASVRLEVSGSELTAHSGFVLPVRKSVYQLSLIESFWPAVQAKDVLKDGLSSNNWIYVRYANQELPLCRSLARVETRAVMDFLAHHVGVPNRGVRT